MPMATERRVDRFMVPRCAACASAVWLPRENLVDHPELSRRRAAKAGFP
jgi:hypothetical protein